MNVKDAIESRRSIRKYQDKPVSKEIINELIEAVMLAPSGNNAQPWKFKIITSREEKEELRENQIFKQDFVYESPVIIVCCADPEAFPERKFEPGYDDSYEIRAIRDLSIACQNLVLRAEELGLGSCYVGWMHKEKIKTVINLPRELLVPYVITLGYADETPHPRKLKKRDEVVL
jgi:nitroreductase